MLTYAQIKPYLEHQDLQSIPAGLKHEYYDDTVTYRKKIATLFQEEYPDYLDKNRPRERPTDRAYRKAIYKNTWEHLPDRVAETLDYIHQADDFGVAYPAPPEGVNPEFSLEKYLGKSLTPDGDLTEWFFNNVVELYLKDPNACTAMVLEKLPEEDLSFGELGLFKPVPVLFPCDNVIMHRKGRLAVMESPEKREYLNPYDQKMRQGRVIHFFDDESYTAAFEVGLNDGITGGKGGIDWRIIGVRINQVFDLTGAEVGQEMSFEPIMHHFDSMPVYKIGKLRRKYNARREEIYKSILDGAKAKIKEAQQLQNDKELENTFHVTSAEWRRKSAFPACPNPQCKSGTVYSQLANGQIDMSAKKKCPTCNGTGLNPSSGSSLEILMVNDGVDSRQIGSNDLKPQTAGAPGGYIERSIEPVKQLKEDLKEVSDDVYQIINMQFIRSTPIGQSGTAKRYDREELYRELNTQAAHLLNILKRQYAMGDHIRYTLQRYVGEQTPDIMVPVRFNLENAELTREELNDAKKNKYDPSLVALLESKLIEYNAGKESVEYNQYVTRVKLDPFRNLNADQKNMYVGMSLMGLKEGEKRDKIIGRIYYSMFFDSYMIRAEIEHKDFYSKEIRERNAILQKYFDEEYEGTREVVMDIDPSTGLAKMPQYAIKPTVNIQDTNQTDKNGSATNPFEK